MTINDLMALNDDELLAALQAALERAEADEVAASARVAKLARAIAAFHIDDVRSESRVADREPLPPSATPKASLPPNSEKDKTPTRRAPRARDKTCERCGRKFAAQGLATHMKGCRPSTDDAAGLVLAAVPDPEPGPPAKVVEREPVPAAEPGSPFHFECTDCPTATFPKLRDLAMHTINRHERQPKPIERRPIENAESVAS